VTLRCMIVDDSRLFLDSARRLLERQGLTIVGVASTTADALRAVETMRPDLVLVDVSLDEEDGFELAERLAADRRHEGVVILISNRLESDLADLVAHSPAVGFLAKANLSADAIRALLDVA
jgi:CheY-like chemotaxis protein